MLEVMSGDTGESLSGGSVASRIKLLKANFEQGQKDSNNQGCISPSPGSPKLKRIDNCMGKNGVLKPVATEATSKLENILGTGNNNIETNTRPSPKPSPRFARKDEGLSHTNRPRFDTAPESEMDARLTSPPSQSPSSKLSKSVSDSILHKDVPVMIKDKSDNPRPSPRNRPPLPKKAIAEEETEKLSGNTREVIERQNQTEEVKKPALQQKPSRPPMPAKPGALPSKAQPRPPLPKKMTLLDRPQKNEHAMSVVIQSSQGYSTKQESNPESNLSWKHRNGPPKRPVPPGPGAKDFNSNVVPSAKEENTPVSIRRAPPVPLPKKDYPVSGDEREMSDSEGKRDVFAPPSPIANRRPVPSPKSKEPQRKGTKPPPVPASKRPNRSMAEEQSLYSYAYDPDMALPALSGPRPLKPELDSDSDESNYESPDSAVVQGMMNSINHKTQNNQNVGRYEDVQPYIKKGTGTITTGEAYVVPDENIVKGFMHSIQNKSDMKGPSSDVEEYDLPDENVIPPPPVKKPENLIMKKVTQMSSYSDDSSTDEDDPTYIDPNSVPRPSRSISSEGRRASHGVLTPDVYLPAEMQEDSDYVDPENLPTVPSHLAAVRTKSDLQTVIAHDDDDSDDDDEPLYQVYAANVFENQRNMSVKSNSDDDQAIDSYGTGTLQRILWSELNSVRRSGILDTMSPEERKRQEAMFEVITSEGSYLKSMHVLCSHFLAAPEFGLNPHIPAEEIVLDKQQIHFLFTGVKSVTSISEQFLAELRQRQEENVLVTSISDIIEKYATSYFDCYVKYCSNQIFQDRTLNALVNNNQRFCEVLSRLESSPKAKGLSMQSFMMLPMQRITRMPLLVDAICHRCEAGSDEFQRTDRALRAVNKVVRDCNEGARRMERTEEMYFLQCMLAFKTKPIPLISSSRWLLRRGEVMCVREESKGPKGAKKSPLIKRLKGKSKEIYLFLFTDLLLVTKMKSGENFKVIDHCSRSMLRVEDIPPQASDTLKPGSPELQPKHVFSLILLENSKGKTVDYVCMVETGTDKLRWLDAFTPSRQGEAEGEKIYEEWDCPQVQAIHTYQATQPDEITLQEGDVVKVLRKLTDGWYEGLRLRDGEQGWFPANHTEEILSEHVRARNLLQRYRLLNASAMIMGNHLKK